MFDMFKKKKPEKKTEPKTDKEIATGKKEPWVSVISIDIDDDDVGNGAFELDWNDYFITKLVRSGYQKKKDDELDHLLVEKIKEEIVLEECEMKDRKQKERNRFQQIMEEN